MRTEIVRHILDGGVLNEDGTCFAHPNVLAEATRTRSFRAILGIEEETSSIGKFKICNTLNYDLSFVMSCELMKLI